MYFDSHHEEKKLTLKFTHLSFRLALTYSWIKSHAILLVLEEAKQKVAEIDLQLLITQAAVGKYRWLSDFALQTKICAETLKLVSDIL